MESIRQEDVKGKKVIVRVDFNVPIKDNKILDDTRIVSSLETINYLINKKAKIILLSHLGRIESQEDKDKNSLEIIAKHLSTLVKTNVIFMPITRSKEIEKTISLLKEGQIILLENTRFEDFPTKLESSCDEALSKYWASLGDIFVLDAFASAHRCHSSTYGISKYLPSYCGLLIEKEVKVLKKVINQRKTLVLGGSKIDDKIGIINNLINTSDYILFAGAMCFTFLKASGYNVGKSIVNEDKLQYAKELLDKHKDKIILPFDIVTQNEQKDIKDIKDDDIGYDIGVKTIKKYKELLINSNLVLCNGPLGMYEEKKYENGTKEILTFLYKQSIPTVLAGGDIIAASNKFKLDFLYISTGGGATLEYLEGKKFKTLENLNGREENKK